MRGALIVIVLITLLIVGVLMIKDMRTETQPGVEKRQVIEKAKNAAQEAEKASRKAAQTMEDVMSKIKDETQNAGAKE